LPSSICRMPAARIICTPVVCCVQPTAYTTALVRSRPELAQSNSATRRMASGVQPPHLGHHLRRIAEKWRLRICMTPARVLQGRVTRLVVRESVSSDRAPRSAPATHP